MTHPFHDEQRPDAAHSQEPLVSIIIDNFNYGHFLPEAIDSALAQSYAPIEVIVVDDGSTDNSREIIASYGNHIRPVLKANGGQASALNAGFEASRGNIVLFLDSDDVLFADAVSNIVPRLPADGVSKVQWPMWLIDSQGEKLGGTRPPAAPPEGDFRQQVLERGPSNVASSPTSGNAWSRSFLEKIMPIPENLAYYRSCADEYLYLLAPVFGYVRTIRQPQGCYRIHDQNIYSSRTFREKLDMELSGYAEQCQALSKTLARNGIDVDGASWKKHSWFHQLDRAIAEFLTVTPIGGECILIDSNTWGAGVELEGRRLRPFLERSGIDWGAPESETQAVEELQNVVDAGVQFLALAWSEYWWLEEYPLLFERLEQTAECVHRSDVLIIFDLQKRPSPVCCSYPPRLVHEDRCDV